jgi:hypothetical protein
MRKNTKGVAAMAATPLIFMSRPRGLEPQAFRRERPDLKSHFLLNWAENELINFKKDSHKLS